MWFIERKSDGNTFCIQLVDLSYNYIDCFSGKKIYLLNKEYTVGRKGCTIQVAEDNTVSRKHLILQPEYSNSNVLI